MNMRFECIKGMADRDNESVIVMQGDVVEFTDSDTGNVYVDGVFGWCSGHSLDFTPKQFTEHFRIIIEK